MTYQACSKWVDVDTCNHADTPLSTNISTNCTALIEPYRIGHCLCHNEAISIWKRCDHEPMTCQDVCFQAIVGCKDPSTQLAVWYSNQDDINRIVGCDGTWINPGLDAASEALCDHENGFEICSELDQVRALQLGEYDCSHLADPNTIYIADIGSWGLLFGCGNSDNFDEIPVTPNEKIWPFSLALNANKLPHESWKSVDHKNFRSAVYKVKDSGGGVLCCRAGEGLDDGLEDAIQMLLEIVTFLIVMFMFSMCIVRSVQYLLQSLDQRCPRCRGRCRWIFNGVIDLCGRWQIPITRAGWRRWKSQRDIGRIKCKTFEEYGSRMEGNDDISVITDRSANCVICLERYQPKDMVIHLNCGHHFHSTCGLPWLQQHQTCPTCRQHFKNAEDMHSYPKEVEMVEMVEMITREPSLATSGKTRSSDPTIGSDYRPESVRNRSLSTKNRFSESRNRSASSKLPSSPEVGSAKQSAGSNDRFSSISIRSKIQ